MTRRKPRSGGHGLFSWAPADGVVPIGELLVNPTTVRCRWESCRATVGQPCGFNGRGGRRRHVPTHQCRKDDAHAAELAAQQPRSET